MKRLCKDICIHDRDLVLRAVAKCMSKPATRRRHDTVKYFAETAGISKHDAAARLAKPGRVRTALYETVAGVLSEDIRCGRLECRPPITKRRVDPSSGKVRDISVLHIRQMLLDHAAVEALKPMRARIGEFQCASMPGRGTMHGLHALKRWVRERGMRYFAHLDIRKFYPSVNKDLLLSWLRKRVANPGLIHLIGSLVRTCDSGVHIGSYLSQTLCILYTSDIYHMVKERLRRKVTRRGVSKDFPMAEHVLMYMDDIILIGRNKKGVEEAASAVASFVSSEMGMAVKPWTVRDLNGGCFIDALGYRVYRDRTTMRRRIAKRAMRCARRILRCLASGMMAPVSLARRAVSYNGWVYRTDSHRFSEKTGWRKVFLASASTVSYITNKLVYEKGALQY